MDPIFIVIAALSILMAFLVGYLLGCRKNADAASQLAMLKQQLADARADAEARASIQAALHNKQLTDARAEADQRLQYQLEMAEKRLIDAKAEAEKRLAQQLLQQEENHKKAIETQKELFKEATQRFMSEAQEKTKQLMEQRGQELSDTNKSQMDGILSPLREAMEAMRKAMNEATLKQTDIGSQMKVSAEQMMQQSEAARRSADELSNALRHRSKVQGDWGETVLSELLTANGLTEGIHFDTQPTMRSTDGKTIRTEEGRQLRPDVILHMDKNREVIIDSKVSLTAYVDYVNADNEVEREQCLKKHIDSINNHVDELSKKDYSSYIRPPKVTVDYVIMFVPHPGAFITALNQKPDLWRRAMERNVFIADEQTLFAALNAVSLNWRQITQAENHEKVYSLASEMINRVGLFWKQYVEIGKGLDKAKKAYDEGAKKLEDKGQSIIVAGRQLVKLGVKSSTANPLPRFPDDGDLLSLP